MYVFTYHTGGRYSGAAANLVRSAVAFGVDVVVHNAPDRGSWWANVAAKSELVAQLREQRLGPMLYLDADCEVLDPLGGLPDLIEDRSLLVRVRPAHNPVRYNCGVMGFGDSPEIVRLTRRWALLTAAFGQRFDSCDQPPLEMALQDVGGVLVVPLAERYNAMPSDVGLVDPVIAHHKASRDCDGLSEWRKRKNLERSMAEQAAKWMRSAPKGGDVSLLYPGDRVVPTEVELQAVGWCPSYPVDVVWAGDESTMWEALKAGVPTVMVPATIGCEDAAAILRSRHDLFGLSRPRPGEPNGLGIYYLASPLLDESASRSRFVELPASLRLAAETAAAYRSE